MKRLGEFFRSVIPADPFQLLFLGGIVSLIAAHGLRWQPAGLPPAGQSAGDPRAVVAIRYSVLHLFHNFLGDGGLFCLFLAGQTSGATSYLAGVRSSVVRAGPDVRPSSLPWRSALFCS